MNGSTFIAIMTGLSLTAAVTYAIAGDWRHAVFWTCASVMNICVTW